MLDKVNSLEEMKVPKKYIDSVKQKFIGIMNEMEKFLPKIEDEENTAMKIQDPNSIGSTTPPEEVSEMNMSSILNTEVEEGKHIINKGMFLESFAFLGYQKQIAK